MARRLIVDTGVLVAAERAGRPPSLPIERDDLALAAVTLAELRVGAELADERRRPGRAAFVAAVLEAVPVVPYDEVVAEVHARLLAHVQRTGRPRGAHDLIIAATASATGRMLLTTDARARFAELPGLTVVTR